MGNLTVLKENLDKSKKQLDRAFEHLDMCLQIFPARMIEDALTPNNTAKVRKLFNEDSDSAPELSSHEMRRGFSAYFINGQLNETEQEQEYREQAAIPQNHYLARSSDNIPDNLDEFSVSHVFEVNAGRFKLTSTGASSDSAQIVGAGRGSKDACKLSEYWQKLCEDVWFGMPRDGREGLESRSAEDCYEALQHEPSVNVPALSELQVQEFLYHTFKLITSLHDFSESTSKDQYQEFLRRIDDIDAIGEVFLLQDNINQKLREIGIAKAKISHLRELLKTINIENKIQVKLALNEAEMSLDSYLNNLKEYHRNMTEVSRDWQAWNDNKAYVEAHEHAPFASDAQQYSDYVEKGLHFKQFREANPEKYQLLDTINTQLAQRVQRLYGEIDNINAEYIDSAYALYNSNIDLKDTNAEQLNKILSDFNNIVAQKKSFEDKVNAVIEADASINRDEAIRQVEANYAAGQYKDCDTIDGKFAQYISYEAYDNLIASLEHKLQAELAKQENREKYSVLIVKINELNEIKNIKVKDVNAKIKTVVDAQKSIIELAGLDGVSRLQTNVIAEIKPALEELHAEDDTQVDVSEDLSVASDDDSTQASPRLPLARRDSTSSDISIESIGEASASPYSTLFKLLDSDLTSFSKVVPFNEFKDISSLQEYKNFLSAQKPVSVEESNVEALKHDNNIQRRLINIERRINALRLAGEDKPEGAPDRLMAHNNFYQENSTLRKLIDRLAIDADRMIEKLIKMRDGLDVEQLQLEQALKVLLTQRSLLEEFNDVTRGDTSTLFTNHITKIRSIKELLNGIYDDSIPQFIQSHLQTQIDTIDKAEESEQMIARKIKKSNTPIFEEDDRDAQSSLLEEHDDYIPEDNGSSDVSGNTKLVTCKPSDFFRYNINTIARSLGRDRQVEWYTRQGKMLGADVDECIRELITNAKTSGTKQVKQLAQIYENFLEKRIGVRSFIIQLKDHYGTHKPSKLSRFWNNRWNLLNRFTNNVDAKALSHLKAFTNNVIERFVDFEQKAYDHDNSYKTKIFERINTTYDRYENAKKAHDAMKSENSGLQYDKASTKLAQRRIAHVYDFSGDFSGEKAKIEEIIANDRDKRQHRSSWQQFWDRRDIGYYTKRDINAAYALHDAGQYALKAEDEVTAPAVKVR